MSVATLSNAGLRPMSAFVVIGFVVLVVAAWVSYLVEDRNAGQPVRAKERTGFVPAFSIADTEGRTLASFVPRFDLEMSPRAMWQAHTPERMAREISAVLGGRPSAEELLGAFLPDADPHGRIRVAAWELSPRQANALTRWVQGEDTGLALEGLSLEPSPERPGAFRLVWEPLVLLSPEQREAAGFTSAWRWGRFLANGIAAALRDPAEPEPRGSEERDAMRAEVWSALLPSAWCRPIEGVRSSCVMDLRALLEEEAVSPWQMRLAFERDRVYPTGPHELFGSWGYGTPEATEPSPREGLELLCSELLEGPEWERLIDRSVPVYRWLQDRTVRGNRENGYLSFQDGAPAPVVETTLDLGLQAFVGRELERLMEEHEPALAMAIVVDVERGEVLAIDAREAYAIGPFSPIYHVFTTGSTMKVLTMASAVEEGVVAPGTTFQVGQGAWRVPYPDGRPSYRVIHEAEGAPTGLITAREALARSSNAGMTQIALRMQASAFRGYLAAAGYGRRPGSGLGPERGGYLAPLPWKVPNTHASVAFGHEISSTVWQHAAGLSTVLRGGHYRPLRILRAVHQGARRWELSPPESVEVFSQRTSETVMDMMRFGAREGTGEDVRDAALETVAEVRACSLEDAAAYLDMGSKTGTAQKVGAEVCSHVELAALERWSADGVPPTKARLAGLRTVAKPHRTNCYTSSICVFGSTADEGRRLMVLVVAEEPRGRMRFGSQVSGPAAGRILLEALGVTRDGEGPRHQLAGRFLRSDVAERNELDEPWRAEVLGW